jgi:hypothetical protein
VDVNGRARHTAVGAALRSMKLACLVAPMVALLAGCLDDPGMEDPELGELESASTLGWSDDAQIPNQQSARQVGLAYFGSRLHMLHNGSAYPNEVWWSRFDGTSWSSNIKITNLSADGTPALAAWNGRLYTAFKKPGANTIVVSSSSSGATWTTPVTAAPTTSGSNANGSYTLTPKRAPSLAVHNNRLYLAHCMHIHSTFSNGDTHDTDAVELWRYDSGTWTRVGPRTLMFDAFECTGVSLASYGGDLHVLYNERFHDWLLYNERFHDWLSDFTYLNEKAFDPDNYTGVESVYTDMQSRRPPSVAVCGSYAYLVHSGDDSPSDIWATRRAVTSTDWPADTRLTNQTSDDGATVGCFGTRPIMVHNGGTNQLWWAHYP